MIKELRRRYPESNIVAVDYDPGASEVNQLNRIKLMLSVAFKNLKKIHRKQNLKKVYMIMRAGNKKSNPMCKRKICIWDMENIIV